MESINMLDPAERKNLCEILSCREINQYLETNDNDFTKLLNRLNIADLSTEKDLRIFDNPFVSTFIEHYTKILLDKIADSIKEYTGYGYDEHAATAKALFESPFFSYTNLYFKLLGKDSSQCAAVYREIDALRRKAGAHEPSENQINALTRKLNILEKELKRSQENCNALQEQNKNLRTSLESAEMALNNVSQSDQEEFKPNLPLQFDDTHFALLVPTDPISTLSLGSVSPSSNDSKIIIRHADLNRDGVYSKFRRDHTLPALFSNKDHLPHSSGPDHVGFFGVWEWTAVLNKTDLSKDSVQAVFKEYIVPIEVVLLKDASSVEHLIHMLSKGISFTPHSKKVMFGVYGPEQTYSGILCTEKDLKTHNGISSFADSCFYIPAYEFSDKNLMLLNNGMFFWNRAFAGMPNRVYRIKNSAQAVKNIILSSLSFSSYKIAGFPPEHIVSFRQFLEHIPVEDVIQNMIKRYLCTAQEAEEHIQDFLDNAGEYLKGQKLENKVLKAALSFNEDLQQRLKAQIKAEEEKKKGTQQIPNLHNSDKENVQQGSDPAPKKAPNAGDIQNLKQQAQSTAQAKANTVNTGGAAKQNSAASVKYRIYPKRTDKEIVTDLNSADDITYTIAGNLELAGVHKDYTTPLAAFLYAAYLKKQPLLLVGPNAADIMQAFCAVVSSEHHAVLSCDGSISSSLIANIGLNNEPIVLINNLFTGSSAGRLPELLSHKDIFFVAVHPYAEDIQVEPKSLFNFMLPLFTEFLVDDFAVGNYEVYNLTAGIQPENTEISKIRISGLNVVVPGHFVRRRILSLMSLMHYLYPDADTDDDFMFALFPIAYALNKQSILKDMLAGESSHLSVSKDIRDNLSYVLAEES